ncbi:cystatin-like fold lipoprotein [Mammaliicoccus sp. B-M10]|uniref:cystatin-like fold lipoprotein n=1 Tax=Mammaliicoccus sp. B-M10 TaxID=2898670 RepID=UPI001EFAB8DE|nr:cystatin-like fold lipoprotein [Mammaliicoccus sp. B-M10]
MHKIIKVLGLSILLLVTLVACSQKTYEKEIDQVIKLRNDDLQEYNVKFNIKKVTKNNSCFKVYEDGNYIAMFVPLHSDDEKEEYIYQKNNGNYELYAESDTQSILDQEPDYTLNCDE